MEDPIEGVTEGPSGDPGGATGGGPGGRAASGPSASAAAAPSRVAALVARRIGLAGSAAGALGVAGLPADAACVAGSAISLGGIQAARGASPIGRARPAWGATLVTVTARAR